MYFVKPLMQYKPCYPSPFAIFLSVAICRKKFVFWLSRAAKHFSAWIQIRNDARLRYDLRALTDPKMPGHGRLPPDANEILKHG